MIQLVSPFWRKIICNSIIVVSTSVPAQHEVGIGAGDSNRIYVAYFWVEKTLKKLLFFSKKNSNLSHIFKPTQKTSLINLSSQAKPKVAFLRQYNKVVWIKGREGELRRIKIGFKTFFVKELSTTLCNPVIELLIQ